MSYRPTTPGGLDSWDSNLLTALVVAAHDAALRVEVRPLSFRYLAIGFSARTRDGSISRGCPTMERAAEIVRTHYRVPEHALAVLDAVGEDPS